MMENLLAYGSDDSSDDNTPHADHDHAGPPHKRARTAALPAALPGLLPSAAEALGAEAHEAQPPQDSSHQGRIRTFAHVEGNYASHVFIAVAIPEKVLHPLDNFLQQVRAKLPALEPVQHSGPQPTPCSVAPVAAAAGQRGVGRPGSSGPSSSSSSSSSRWPSLVQQQYHISLSRTAPVRLHQIESLVATLKQYLRKLDTFCIALGQPEVLINDERTRTFLSLPAAVIKPPQHPGRASSGRAAVTAGVHPTSVGGGSSSAAKDPLLRAINATSKAFQLHGLPRFYADPRPHISMAWLLGDCEQQLIDCLADWGLQHAAEALGQCQWQVQVDRIYCKCGQKSFVVWEAGK